MSKFAERIKANAKQELMKTTLVIVGAVGGIAIVKGVRKLTEAHPTADTIVKFGLPSLMLLGGFGMAAGTEKDSKVKYLGYGLVVGGSVCLVRAIPYVGDYLSGVTDDTPEQVGNTYYTEEQSQVQGLGDPVELPVGNAAMQEIPGYETRLPEFQGVEDQTPVEGLGYNGNTTSDVDDIVSGII